MHASPLLCSSSTGQLRGHVNAALTSPAILHSHHIKNASSSSSSSNHAISQKCSTYFYCKSSHLTVQLIAPPPTSPPCAVSILDTHCAPQFCPTKAIASNLFPRDHSMLLPFWATTMLEIVGWKRKECHTVGNEQPQLSDVHTHA
ncbi:hypothetical protein TcWFU_004672 [Taenia crassiceps]|uniref:Uncharacterized protein n=1 Tax=Taenia crassiceps TaxID=6207 RepID=A0ABR4Q5N6_9CEST